MKCYLLIIFLFIHISSFSQIANFDDTLSSRKVDSVIVFSRKPYIQNFVDKTVLNIEAKLSTVGQNALELLKSAPGVVIDPNENILMSGKSGVAVYINGRNTQLTGQDLAQILKSIEGENIKEIELINNPSSRYDAAGNAGIINIKLKKNILNGMNGNVSSSYSQSVHARNNGTAAFNIRDQKWNLYSNMGFNSGVQHVIANNNRKTENKNFMQTGIEEEVFGGYNIRTGIDFAVNKKNTVGVLWMFNEKQSNMYNRNNTIVQKFQHLDTTVFTQSKAPFQTKRNNLNLNYRYADNKGSELNMDADYSLFGSSLFNTVNIDQLNAKNDIFSSLAAQNNASVNISIKSLKADYIKKMGDNGKLEFGVKSVFTATHNNLSVLNGQNGNWIPDSVRTNVFEFHENIHAAYMNFEKKWTSWSVQGGIRAEQTQVKGKSIDLNMKTLIKPDTAYLNVFPTLFIQYAPNEKNQFGLMMVRRIDRPSYQDQNPFVYVLDAFNSEVGNPFLLPQFSNNIQLSYTYLNNTTAKIIYSQTSHFVETLVYQKGNQTISIPQNAGSRQMINFNVSSSVDITKHWSMYGYAEPFFQHFNIRLDAFNVNEAIEQKSWGFNGYVNNGFSFEKGWKAELSGWFNFQNTTTIYRSKPLGSINLGINKKIISEKGSLKLTLTDIFNTQRWEQQTETNTFLMNTYRKWESRNITIGFTYRFGNNKIKKAREREAGVETEINRIK